MVARKHSSDNTEYRDGLGKQRRGQLYPERYMKARWLEGTKTRNNLEARQDWASSPRGKDRARKSRRGVWRGRHDSAPQRISAWPGYQRVLFW